MEVKLPSLTKSENTWLGWLELLEAKMLGRCKESK